MSETIEVVGRGAALATCATFMLACGSVAGESASAGRAAVAREDVYVAEDGDDAAAGEADTPKRTIGAALAAVRGRRARVVVCTGTYNEHVVLGAETGADGIVLSGGFRCARIVGDPAGARVWTYSGERAVIEPSSEGYALRIDAAGRPNTVSDLAFHAEAAAFGRSSVAGLVRWSSDVTLERVVFRAGVGSDAPAGAREPEPCAPPDPNPAAEAMLEPSEPRAAEPGEGARRSGAFAAAWVPEAGTDGACTDANRGVGGAGGGASIALATVHARTKIVGGELVAADAGAGAAADARGGGGAGAGGVSVALAFVGDLPELADAPAMRVGAAGTAGAGVGRARATDGIAQPVFRMDEAAR